MKDIKQVHNIGTEDISINVKAESFKGLIIAAMEGMNGLLKENAGEIQHPKLKIRESVEISSADERALLVDFLSEVLTRSYSKKALFYRADIEQLIGNNLRVWITGTPIPSFDKEIKAVFFRSTEIKRNEEGNWEADIAFDIEA